MIRIWAWGEWYEKEIRFKNVEAKGWNGRR